MTTSATEFGDSPLTYWANMYDTVVAISAAVGVIDDFTDTEIAAILADTTVIGTPAGASIAADIAAIKTVADTVSTAVVTSIPALVGAANVSAQDTVATDKSIMAYAKGILTDTISLEAKTALPAPDAATNTLIGEVIGNKTDTVAGTSLIALAKQILVDTGTDIPAAFTAASTDVGTVFAITATVVSSGIPNNTQTGGAFTGAASGTLLVEDIIINTNATGLAAPTNLEISSDNANGVTGAAAPLVLEGIGSFAGNKTFTCKEDAASLIPFVIESGKKLYIHGDDAAGTGAGVASVTVVLRRLTAGATIAAANIAGI